MQLTIILIVLIGFVSTQVPIPSRPDGYGVGGPADAHVVIDMFLDPLSSQGLHVIANVTNRNLDAIYLYTTKVFENQTTWYNDATKSMTIPQVIDSLATFVNQIGLVSKDKFMVGMMSDDINDETRISWKYACSRGVVGTPTFLINGVITSAGPSWSLSDWKSVIDTILATNENTSSNVKDCPTGQSECNYAPHKSQCCLAGERCIANVGCRC
ncbi:unnamed protein product [Rotaria sp. Silwood2]|nr:unnamed protein product [Rotaria sp. Silwood2]CAF3942547.1 unnamed protein product [Rotaria sp. Silwood2]